MLAEVNARVAVSSRSCASAAAVGCRVSPAPDTGTGSVGFGISVPLVGVPAVPDVVTVTSVDTVVAEEVSGVWIADEVILIERVLVDWGDVVVN